MQGSRGGETALNILALLANGVALFVREGSGSRCFDHRQLDATNYLPCRRRCKPGPYNCKTHSSKRGSANEAATRKAWAQVT